MNGDFIPEIVCKDKKYFSSYTGSVGFFTSRTAIP